MWQWAGTLLIEQIADEAEEFLSDDLALKYAA